MRGIGGEESDPVGQATGVFDQVVAQGGELFDDDPLGGFSQCHVDQGGPLEVDFDQVRDAALDQVPGRLIGGARPFKDFPHSQPDAFLPAFEFLEHTDSRLVSTALLSCRGEQLDGLVLLGQQLVACLPGACHVGLDCFEFPFRFAHPGLPQLALALAGLPRSGEFLELLTGLGLFDVEGAQAALQRRDFFVAGGHDAGLLELGATDRFESTTIQLDLPVDGFQVRGSRVALIGGRAELPIEFLEFLLGLLVQPSRVPESLDQSLSDPGQLQPIGVEFLAPTPLVSDGCLESGD